MTDREKEIEFLSTMLALRGLIASVVTPSRSGHKKLITSGRLLIILKSIHRGCVSQRLASYYKSLPEKFSLRGFRTRKRCKLISSLHFDRPLRNFMNESDETFESSRSPRNVYLFFFLFFFLSPREKPSRK